MAKRKGNRLIMPFVKWVGGKRQLLPDIRSLILTSKEYNVYMEPFVGGGALFFDLEPVRSYINDSNQELINVYNTIKYNVNELIESLQSHVNEAEYFYNIRGIDRTAEYLEWTNIQKASRFLYLNKTCYNGLYRVNNAGHFNAPYGNYKNPNIVNEPVLRAINIFLNTRDVIIRNDDYKEILALATKDTFVYLDPPYYPLSGTSNFTGYVPGGWGEREQIELKESCDDLNARGIKFLLSNSSAYFIRELYADYVIQTVGAIRSINSKGTQRGEVNEFLIKNY